MKRFIFLLTISLLFSSVVIAQDRVIDATDRTPIAAASIFDSTGNIVGLTLINGDFPDIPESAYPITLRCIGYEELTIESPNNKTWEMTPTTYELSEIVVVPVKRNVLKQSFYVREYFSLNNDDDTVTVFMEHMAVRFVPTTKDAKFGGKTSLRILNSRSCSLYNVDDTDSLAVHNKSKKHLSMMSLCKLEDSQIDATKYFEQQSGSTKLYQKAEKSGMSVILKQNAQTFTIIEDLLADEKNHCISPAALKLLGATMDINQLMITQTYRANDKYIYQPKDFVEASFAMEANGRGKYIRGVIDSKTPVLIRAMVEIYLVDSEYLTKEEAKQEYKDKEIGLGFTIPSTVPPLNAATQRIVTRAKTETNKWK